MRQRTAGQQARLLNSEYVVIMADKGGAKVAGRKDINPLIIVDQINKELMRQRNYGLEWGALVPEYPKTYDERLQRRVAELEALRAKAVATGAAGIAFTTTYGAEYARKDGPTLTEARRLNKAFRTLKAGV